MSFNSSNLTEFLGPKKTEKHILFVWMLHNHQKPHPDAGHTALEPILTLTPHVKHIWGHYDLMFNSVAYSETKLNFGGY